MPAVSDIAVRIERLTVKLGGQTILRDVALQVRRGEILGLVGASGGGKSVLLRTVLGLIPKTAGLIEILGMDREQAIAEALGDLERRWGVLFQQGALFSSLTVFENIEFPMREYLQISPRMMREVATAKLEMVGLDPAAGLKFPSTLSGGMIKRVGLARALALDPEIVFLDEPTSGLDPISASEFDSLIRTLQKTLGLTVFMITHDLDSLRLACDRVAVLADGKIVAIGPLGEVVKAQHSWVQTYFHADRAHVGMRASL